MENESQLKKQLDLVGLTDYLARELRNRADDINEEYKPKIREALGLLQTKKFTGNLVHITETEVNFPRKVNRESAYDTIAFENPMAFLGMIDIDTERFAKYMNDNHPDWNQDDYFVNVGHYPRLKISSSDQLTRSDALNILQKIYLDLEEKIMDKFS